MFANERHNKIMKMIQANGAVMTAVLVEEFKVSVETIRRDLMAMEQDGKLVRVHGGAIAINDMKPFAELKQRHKEYSEQKYELSRKAVEFIDEGDIIAIDSGSTAISLAEVIKSQFKRLTVVTHSLDVFEILRNCDGFEVILCGGHYMQNENSFYGALTLDTLSKLHVQKSFVFPSAISLKYGIADFQGDLYQVQKKIIDISDNAYILADSSKFEKKALLKLEDMKTKYIYITDSELTDELKTLYSENDIKIYN